MTTALMTTDLPLANRRTGKIRDLYDLTLNDGSDGILIIATDRISAFDVVLENGIPGKGVVLTRISKFWFDLFSSEVDHHLISVDSSEIEAISDEQKQAMDGRIMICRKTKVVPVECIVRGYLTGSGWVDYQKTGKLCGIQLPAGMVNCDRIESPLFTPSTKAEEGHDENISFEQACETAGEQLMNKIKQLSIDIYTKARDYAAQKGIIIADTKFEFGVSEEGGDPVLIDEVLTPDSSRFWPADQWQPGREQNSFDKQYVRNYLLELVKAGEWDKQYPGPSLPEEVVVNTLARYRQACDQLTGGSMAF
ncbi:MAG: phosphoribosylaminoimidazolesuccinocarboxamide synthase [Pseudomonadales bacterium]|jgi:phosphoribosylaminoimidazole-succinocarboxamide synthase|nr:phosphoribosylaminoimidazolesuccinocarboxamide synthase [Pseudomonadales bacterium]MDP7594707.1 phosphoribosylaminoimidazolesuccinocarboxamide synthase [Pseudomonadales bacterium]HJN48980.1 phosphoribosylaminoimidazolesuccinocarboxamide synthase [Pseudomonadales bacterium]|tara:strand:- start:2046 stop:2969 length:924 start_codon:yes stop_codon:yes gene_type:complete